ncbi:unnamed protein product [Fraxinus pennsylvanica]|uniref:Uncharacterized protein n=1 Tax=Fraxinus pennsylvanica TaxID=56036 RepID=A0AAD1ZGS2_9LAMI|nr:unnamed protein product [Fraxinus pennsylvanica]
MLRTPPPSPPPPPAPPPSPPPAPPSPPPAPPLSPPPPPAPPCSRLFRGGTVVAVEKWDSGGKGDFFCGVKRWWCSIIPFVWRGGTELIYKRVEEDDYEKIVDFKFFPSTVQSGIRGNYFSEVTEKLTTMCVLPILIVGVLGHPSKHEELTQHLINLFIQSSRLQGVIY